MKFIFAVAMLLAVSIMAEILPAITLPLTNSSLWPMAGVSNGIPSYPNCVNVTDYGAVADGTTDNTTAFNNALAACTNGGAVYIPGAVGHYKLSSTITLSYPNRKVFRGDGPTQTKLDCYGSGGAFVFGADGTRTICRVTNGFSRGSTNLTITNSTGLVAGKHVRFMQENGTNTWGHLSGQPNPVQGQAFRIASVSSTNVTTYDPIYFQYYCPTNDPRFEEWSSAAQRCGLENLGINYLGAYQYNIFFQVADECWVSNVASSNAAADNIYIENSYGCTVKGCQLIGVQGWLGTSQYGVAIATFSGKNLIEDNIIQGYSTAFLCQISSAGNVMAYNFGDTGGGTATGNAYNGISAHGDDPQYNLFEGNIFPWWGIDCTWGLSPLNTAFRNWATRVSRTNLTIAGLSTPDVGLIVDATNYNVNVVGNITGLPNQFGGTTSPYKVGIARCWDDQYDPNVAATLFWHGNFNFVTNTTEWSNSVSHMLPSSYYLSGKPDWFGRLDWPPIGPDVSVCTNTTITNVYLIPAQARWFGVDYFGTNGVFSSAVLRNCVLR